MSLTQHAPNAPADSGLCPAVLRSQATDAAHFAIDHAAALTASELNGWSLDAAEADQAFCMATVYIARAIRLGDRSVAALLHQVCDWEAGR